MRSVIPFFHPLGSGDEPSPPPTTALGHDLGVWLVERDGAVVTSDPLGHYPDRYVSASTNCFEALLDAFDDWYSRLSDDAVPDAASMDRLRGAFERLDPTALAGADHWWPSVIEQVEMGLL